MDKEGTGAIALLEKGVKRAEKRHKVYNRRGRGRTGRGGGEELVKVCAGG